MLNLLKKIKNVDLRTLLMKTPVNCTTNALIATSKPLQVQYYYDWDLLLAIKDQNGREALFTHDFAKKIFNSLKKISDFDKDHSDPIQFDYGEVRIKFNKKTLENFMHKLDNFI